METQDRAGEQEAKLAHKSNDITRMPMQGASKEIPPGSKKTRERKQNAAKKSHQAKKQGLLKFFGKDHECSLHPRRECQSRRIRCEEQQRAVTPVPNRRGIQATVTKPSVAKNQNQTMRNHRLRRLPI